MIRRALGLAVAVLAAGCGPLVTSDGQRVRSSWNVADVETRVHDRAGTGWYDPRWSFDPDSHPAVRPVHAGAVPADGTADSANGAAPAGAAAGSGVGVSTAEAQGLGAGVGALIGAQAARRTTGIAFGSGLGALAGGALADPCAPGFSGGALAGMLAGGWLGQLFGGGRARDLWTAIGAAGGAVRGGEMAGGNERCRQPATR